MYELKPDFVEAYNNMGIALRGQNKFDEAIEVYEKQLLLKQIMLKHIVIKVML